MQSEKPYQICTRCVMDTSDPDIEFDDLGQCNHCRDYAQKISHPKLNIEEGNDKIEDLVSRIKTTGKSKKYDCLIGISGGVDSCYVAYLCHKWGLNPLLIHLDNGWNTDIAVKNVKKIVDKLEFDYISYVLDWREFREIQLGFLKSSIVDLEMPTDIAIAACQYEIASKYNIKYLVSGGNYSGEGILPLTWGYHVLKDEKLYRHIVRKYSNTKIRKVPIVGLKGEIYYKFIKRIKTVYPLNLVNYNKDKAREFLKKEFDWQDYGGKHHESKITGFWQSYVMPTKYNMDYRRATFSSQIVSGHITRDEALAELKSPPYKEDMIEKDKAFVAKKFGITFNDLERYLSLPPKTYKDFPNDKNKIEWFYKMYMKFK